MQLHDFQLQVKEQACEQTLQSIATECAETELVVNSEQLPDRFTEYSLLSVEDKVKRYQMTGKEDAYSMVEHISSVLVILLFFCRDTPFF